MRKYLAVATIVVAGFLGFFLGQVSIQSKWDNEKLKTQALIIEYQNKVKRLEIDHSVREADIIKTFEQVKKDYENTIRDISSAHSDSLLKYEERADHYREEYQQCSDKRIIERAVLLDRYLSEGVILVEELEAIIRFKEQVIDSLDAVIDNDRILINSR